MNDLGRALAAAMRHPGAVTIMSRPFLALLIVATATAAEVTQDADGRIPWREAPAEVEPRDRWRYLPPERIVPGNAWERLGVTTFAFPVFFSEEAVGSGAGFGLVDTDFRTQRRAEALGLFASASSEGQTEAALFWRRALKRVEDPSGGIFLKESAQLSVQAGYRRTLTRRFFGLGPDTTADDETSLIDEVASLGGRIEGEPLAALPALTLSLGLRGELRHLADGRVEDVPSALDEHRSLLAPADDRQDLITSFGATWDGRDSRANPYHGGSLAWDAEAWRAEGARLEARATGVIALPSPFHDSGVADLATRGREENPPTDVLAIGLQLQQAVGDLPFHALPSLGGSRTLRGYLADRFTDRTAWHGSVEWRTWIIPRGFPVIGKFRIERFGLAPFWDVGTVAPDLRRLPNAKLHHNPGIGVRFAFERALVLRLDIARSNEQTGVNLDMGMAF